MNKDTWVVIPVYNEQAVVREVLKNVKKYFSNIVCVDDGSIDNSIEEICKEDVSLVKHSINLGAGAAMQTGLDYAMADKHAKYFITMDSDGQHSTEDAVQMLSYIKKHQDDVVIGSRFLGTYEGMAFTRHMLLKLAAVFSYLTTGVWLTDPHIGLRVFNRSFAESLNLKMHDFAHASELIGRIKQGNFKYAEVPVTVVYTSYSTSKGQSSINAINIALDLMLQKITRQ